MLRQHVFTIPKILKNLGTSSKFEFRDFPIGIPNAYKYVNKILFTVYLPGRTDFISVQYFRNLKTIRNSNDVLVLENNWFILYLFFFRWGNGRGAQLEERLFSIVTSDKLIRRYRKQYCSTCFSACYFHFNKMWRQFLLFYKATEYFEALPWTNTKPSKPFMEGIELNSFEKVSKQYVYINIFINKAKVTSFISTYWWANRYIPKSICTYAYLHMYVAYT